MWIKQLVSQLQENEITQQLIVFYPVIMILTLTRKKLRHGMIKLLPSYLKRKSKIFAREKISTRQGGLNNACAAFAKIGEKIIKVPILGSLVGGAVGMLTCELIKFYVMRPKTQAAQVLTTAPHA